MACRSERPKKQPNEARPLPPCPHPLFTVSALFGRHQDNLLEDMGGPGLAGLTGSWSSAGALAFAIRLGKTVSSKKLREIILFLN